MATITDVPPRRLSGRGTILLLGVLGLSPFAFALYTNHIWEDFFITFRHSRNLCEGHGMVYYPGERVHGFTSPLGTLLPALCYLATGMRSYVGAIWGFRVLSIAAFALGGLLLWRRMEREEPTRWLPRVALAVLYALEVKSASFTINGMETAFMLMFLAWQVDLLLRDFPGRWLYLGLCWGGLMWTRPDGCVYIAAMSAVEILFSKGSRRRCLVDILKAAAVCTAVYLPWFGGAWWYYGSPVPQTVLAKSNLVSWTGGGFNPIERYLGGIAKVFLPIYFDMGGGFDWYPGIYHWSAGLGVFCASYWILPTSDRLGRACSLAFAMLGLYLSLLNYMFPWYAPPALMLGLVVLARGVTTLVGVVAGRGRIAAVVAGLILAAIAAERGALYVCTATQMRVQMAEVEMGNRARVGDWLKRHMEPGDTVYLECTGYIGYFSDAKIRDWPGLVAPEVSRLAQKEGRDFYSVVPALRPDWVVLRPWESQRMVERYPTFLQAYRVAAQFDVTPKIQAVDFLPGRMYLMNDAVFNIFQRIKH
ncbi:hypothetical protein [Singulisphaera sp. PoT]|uniref:hypothetical protein n=1 Tax=Singulisphaera sp. PoT TaxID=3411797 RepID=UPI003BF61298